MISARRVQLAALGFLVAAAGQSTVHAESAKYEIDPEHFSVGFLVDHVGYAKTLGMFLKAEGSFTFDEDTLALSDVRIVVDTDSVFTNHERRDKHLRSADFLNSREFPEMVFEGRSSEQIGPRTGTLTGDLTLLGQAKPLTLDIVWNKSGVYPFGHKKPTVGISARGSFKRSSYDMNYAVANGWVGDDIELIIEFEAIRQD